MNEVTGYTNDDVNTVLKKVYENAVKDREEALQIYELVKQKILDGSPDAIFLMDKANFLLQTANKNSEILVRLAGVIQRLQTNTITSKKANLLTSENYNKLLRDLDETDKQNKIDAKFLVETSITGDK